LSQLRKREDRRNGQHQQFNPSFVSKHAGVDGDEEENDADEDWQMVNNIYPERQGHSMLRTYATGDKDSIYFHRRASHDVDTPNVT
jgi:hypothetical protein